MAVTLIGAGGLFTRLGKLADLVDKSITHQTQVATELTDISGQFTGDPELVAALINQQITLQTGVMNATFPAVRNAAEYVVVEMVNDDTQLPVKDLTSALKELIRQMESSGDDVDGSTCSIDPGTADGTNTGNGILYRSANTTHGTGATGDVAQYLRPELLVLRCTKDAQVSGTAGRETFSLEGEQSFGSPTDPRYTGGSGILSELRVTDPSEDAQQKPGRNTLVNSDFDSFTVTNTPDNWTINVGSVGTHILEEGTIIRRTGGKSIRIKGDGSNLTSIQQTFNLAGNTTAKIKPKTKYMVIMPMRRSAGVAAGVVRISIKDGSNTIMWSSDTSLTVSTISAAVFDVTTKEFNSGYDVPSTVKIVVELTTAITNLESLYIDDLCLIEMSGFGPGPSAPYLNIFRGTTDFVVNDRITTNVLNANEGAFQKHFDRWFDMYALNLRIPFDTGGTETVLDSLIS